MLFFSWKLVTVHSTPYNGIRGNTYNIQLIHQFQSGLRLFASEISTVHNRIQLTAADRYIYIFLLPLRVGGWQPKMGIVACKSIQTLYNIFGYWFKSQYKLLIKSR